MMDRSARQERLSECMQWPGGFGNWGRWDNDRGTLNLITDERVRAAAATVRTGQVFGLGSPLVPDYAPDELRDLHKFPGQGFEHQMLTAHEMASGRHAAADRISVSLHSLENTHLDALSHVGHLGKGFNGVPFDEMVTMDGAHRFDITEVMTFVTRAVIIDVPRLRGVAYLEPGDSVTADDLRAGAAEVEPGDALLIRTGRWLAPPRRPGNPATKDPVHGDWAALDVDALAFVAERDVAVVGTDSVGDTFPSPHPAQPSVHIVALVYLGLPLLHSLDLERLAEACAREGRATALLSVGALNIKGATGSPVTPVCVI